MLFHDLVSPGGRPDTSGELVGISGLLHELHVFFESGVACQIQIIEVIAEPELPRFVAHSRFVIEVKGRASQDTIVVGNGLDRRLMILARYVS